MKKELIQLKSPTFLSLLPAPLVDKVTQAGTIIKYSDEQLIHSRGEIKPGLSIVRSGAVNVGVYGADGKFLMVAKLGPGETFGEFTIFTVPLWATLRFIKYQAAVLWPCMTKNRKYPKLY